MPVLSLFFVPTGRISRGVFWLGMLGLWAVAAGIWFVSTRVRVGPSGWLWEAMLLWPWLCLSVKRLHDRNRSGWWMVLPLLLNGLLIFVLAVSFVMAFSFGSSAPDPETGRVSSTGAMNLAGAGIGLVTLLVLAVFNLAFLAWVGLARSDPSANRFGPGREPPAAAA